MKIRELMHHHPITIQLDADVETAARLLQKLDVRHLPVLDGTKLVGMVSDRDLAEVMYHDPLGGDSKQQQVKELMESDVVSVRPESSVREGIDLITERRVGALPVVEEGHVLVGIVSYVDVLRALSSAL
jgi:acetoin utilization protein AcuB